jgi:hypothetical protein
LKTWLCGGDIRVARGARIDHTFRDVPILYWQYYDVCWSFIGVLFVYRSNPIRWIRTPGSAIWRVSPRHG